MNDTNKVWIPTEDEFFEAFVKKPSQWVSSAQIQYWAANDLFEKSFEAFAEGRSPKGNLDDRALMMVRMQFFQPASMLAGFSIELMAKAAIAHQYPERLIRGKKIRWTEVNRDTGHNLLKLCAEANLTVSDAEILEMLTQFVTWKGRYPAARTGRPYYGMAPIEHYAGTHWPVLWMRIQEAYEEVRFQTFRLLGIKKMDD